MRRVPDKPFGRICSCAVTDGFQVIFLTLVESVRSHIFHAVNATLAENVTRPISQRSIQGVKVNVGLLSTYDECRAPGLFFHTQSFSRFRRRNQEGCVQVSALIAQTVLTIFFDD